MSNYHERPFDINALAGKELPADYIHQEQERELAEILAEQLTNDSGHGLEEESGEVVAWKDSKKVAGVLIKKACEHSSCSHSRCQRSLRIQGIEI